VGSKLVLYADDMLLLYRQLSHLQRVEMQVHAYLTQKGKVIVTRLTCLLDDLTLERVES